MNNGFKERKVKSDQALGDKLEEARKDKSLSLSEVAEKINIQKQYLEYLEKGKYSKLPASVYTLGYLRSYAKFLDLDIDKIIKIYKREQGLERIINSPKKEKNDFLSSFPVIITPKMIQISAIVLVVLGIVFYLWYQVSGLSRPPELEIFDPEQDKTVSEDLVVITGRADLDSVVAINEQPIHIDSQGNFKENISLQKGLNVLTIKASNRFNKNKTIERKIMYEPSEEVALNNSNEAEEGSEQKKEGEEEKDKKEIKDKVYLKITIKEKATWIHVEADNKIVYSGTMLPDSKQEFIAKEKIVLSSGKANTTYVNFNGKELGALGEVGEVIREMIFTKDLEI